MLWHFTAKYCPQGDIGRFEDSVIAKAVDWEVRSGSSGVRTEVKLRSALVEAGFIDTCTCHRLVVHDWSDHADQAVTKYLDRRRISFVHPRDILPLPVPLPEPKPLPVPAPVLPSAVDVVRERAVSSASPPSGPVESLPKVSTEVQEAGKETSRNGTKTADIALSSQKKKPKSIPLTKAEYELWQQEQERAGRVQ